MDLIYASFIEVIRASTGREHAPEQIRALFGPTEEAILRRQLGEAAESAMGQFMELYQSGWDARPRATERVRELLAKLGAAGFRIGVATGGGERRARLTMERLDLGDLVDRLVTGSPEGSIKPQLIRGLAAEWGIRLREVAYVGDAVSDMRDALRAGAIPLGAAWYGGGDSPDDLRAAGACEVFVTIEAAAGYFLD